MMTKTLSADDLLQQLGELQPLIRAHARWSEENCRMHPDVFAALSGAGLFSIWKPAQLGGSSSIPSPLLPSSKQQPDSSAWLGDRQPDRHRRHPRSLLGRGGHAGPRRSGEAVAAWSPPGRADVVPDGYRPLAGGRSRACVTTPRT